MYIFWFAANLGSPASRQILHHRTARLQGRPQIGRQMPKGILEAAPKQPLAVAAVLAKVRRVWLLLSCADLCALIL